MSAEVRELGAGPAVALIHGFAVPPEHFDGLARSLAMRHRVIVVELPGYGRSPRLEAAGALDATHAAVAESLVRHSAADAFLVGISFGGYRALALAGSPLLRPRGVVSLGGFANLTLEERAAYREVKRLAPPVDQLLELFLPNIFAQPFAAKRPDAVAEVRGWASQLDRETLLGELEAIAGSPDLQSTISGFGFPIGACAGSQDAVIPAARSEEIVSSASHPRSRFQVLPGIGHMVLFEAPEQVARFVLEMTNA